MITVLARHSWLAKCTISEMLNTETEERYFVATVLGWRGFYIQYLPTNEVIRVVKDIRERIERDDKTVFEDPKFFKENISRKAS